MTFPDDGSQESPGRLDRLALYLLLARRLLWLVAGGLCIGKGIEGLRAGRTGAGAVGLVAICFVGAFMFGYAIRSAVRLLRI